MLVAVMEVEVPEAFFYFDEEIKKAEVCCFKIYKHFKMSNTFLYSQPACY